MAIVFLNMDFLNMLNKIEYLVWIYARAYLNIIETAGKQKKLFNFFSHWRLNIYKGRKNMQWT